MRPGTAGQGPASGTVVDEHGETGRGVDFEQFLDRELEGLTRYARLLCGDRDRAHDVLTDALVKAQAAWPRITLTDRPIAYVRRIVTNTLTSERRSWFARTITLTRSGELPDTPAPAAGARVEDRDALDRLLQTLPDRQRTAVVLRYYLDLGDDEIAAEMRCSVSAVRSYISRGLAALRVERTPLTDQEDRRGRG